MQKRSSFFPGFLIFLFLALIIFFFSLNGFFPGVGGFFEGLTLPLQRLTFSIFHTENKSTEDKLREENRDLLTQLAKQKEIEKENSALHDQFAVSNPPSQKLLPAEIIGRQNDQLILDKGARDGLKVKQVVVYKDNLIGVISHLSTDRAIVNLVSNSAVSFTAQASKTQTQGVIKGQGAGDIVLDNVVLSEKLNKDDLVTTRGDVDANGLGFPPNLVVGKIISVNKKASALFQNADVQSLVDVGKLETVFIIIK